MHVTIATPELSSICNGRVTCPSCPVMIMAGMQDKSAYKPAADSPLKVSLVTETWSPEINGVARTLGRLVDGLLLQGHQVELVRPARSRTDCASTTNGYQEFLTPGLPIPFYPELRFGMPAATSLARRWSDNPPHIVHIATEGPLGHSAMRAARKLGLPVCTTFHTNFDAYSRHYRIGWLRGAITRYLRHFHNRAETTLVPTRRMATDLKYAGYQRVDVLSRGVDTLLFNPAQRSADLRRQWGAGPATLVVCCVGRLAPEKNLDLVISAHAALSKRHPDMRLLWVGDGPSRRSLQNRHPDHIHAGMRSGTDLAAHYASADLFLFPSLTETFGNVVLEALASGLPVVAFNHAAAGDVIRDGINGRLVPAGDAKAFSAAAVSLAENPTELDRMKRNAAASIAAYRWDRIHTQFATALRATITAHARRQARADALLLIPD